jgi:hypothetical protein
MTSTTKAVSIAGGAVLAAALTTVMFVASSGVTRVAPGEDLQAAINSAQCGAVIELDAGAAYPANIKLPKKDCTEFITIQSSRAAELPQGQRIDPVAQASLLATLESTVNAEPVIQTATGAHHYKFIGLRIKTQSESVFVYDLVRFGSGRQEQTTPDSVPHHLIVDRSYIHGNGEQETQRAVTLNCADCGVTNSYISNIKARGMDTQAVLGWNGTLRAFILNNYLEAAGENIMLGGADPANEAMIPTLVEIRRNHIRKPMEWKGKGYTIKNLYEVKNCHGCTFDGNLAENNWGGEGQSGIALLLTVRNQEGTAPYSNITNSVITNSIVRNSTGAINLLGTDNEKPSQRANAALIANNVFDQITGPFITINGFPNVTVENNTDLQSCSEGCNTITLYGEQSMNYIHRNNIHDERAYGIFGDGGTQGKAALDKYAPNAIVTGNLVARAYSPWPTGNETVEALTITSDYRTPYPGKGANVDAIIAAMAGVGPTQPTPSPSVTATVTVSPSPSVVPSVSPTVVPLPTATAQPTSTPTVTPTPQPSPVASPSSSPLRICRPDELMTTPPSCRCTTKITGRRCRRF